MTCILLYNLTTKEYRFNNSVIVWVWFQMLLFQEREKITLIWERRHFLGLIWKIYRHHITGVLYILTDKEYAPWILLYNWSFGINHFECLGFPFNGLYALWLDQLFLTWISFPPLFIEHLRLHCTACSQRC